MAVLVAEPTGVVSSSISPVELEHVTQQTLQLARGLAQEIADVADADQWSINLVGLPSRSEGEPQALFPETWLQALNGGAPARYRMILLLQAYGRPLGTVRLSTVRPSGFSDQEVRYARILARRAGVMIADALDHREAVQSLARDRSHSSAA